MKDLLESLGHLRTDYIDLYWLHRDDPKRSIAEILETLNDLTDAGKIRYFGCSNWEVPRIREAMKYASDQGMRGFVANQMMWSLAIPNPTALEKSTVTMSVEGIELHKETQLTAIPFTT